MTQRFKILATALIFAIICRYLLRFGINRFFIANTKITNFLGYLFRQRKFERRFKIIIKSILNHIPKRQAIFFGIFIVKDSQTLFLLSFLLIEASLKKGFRLIFRPFEQHIKRWRKLIFYPTIFLIQKNCWQRI